MSELVPEKEQSSETLWETMFQVFCAVVFLSMIGMVFYNAVLRYVFHASFPPSEEWSRILFIYITFFGAIEAFYRGRHIAVDMVTGKLHGVTRKSVDIVAQILALSAIGLLLIGGISLVRQTMDTYTVATNMNMAFVNGTLPFMALVVFYIRFRELLATIRKPAAEFRVNPAGIEGIE
jgi:TRAP-type C4-dicarboxylate transport system permease small subunit